MTTPQSGEALSGSTGPTTDLATAIDIYQTAALGQPLEKEKFTLLLRALLNETFPMNVRNRIAQVIPQRAVDVPDLMGETLKTLLTAIGNSSGAVQETTVRGLPVLCRGMIPATRNRMVCELSDVLLQISLSVAAESSLRGIADSALEEMVDIDAKAVMNKLFYWLSDARNDEQDKLVLAAERAFAWKKLKAIVEKKSAAMAAEATRDVLDLLITKMTQCRTAAELASLWTVSRSIKCFDPREAQLLLSKLLKAKDPSSEKYIIEIIILEPAIARNLDPEFVGPFVEHVLTTAAVNAMRPMQAVAILSAGITEAAAQKLFPGLVDVLAKALPTEGLPANLSYVEALLATFTQLARKVPTMALKLIESKAEGAPKQLFTRARALKVALAKVSQQGVYAAARATLAGTATRLQQEAHTCLLSIPLYLEELAKDAPSMPRPCPLSWESPYTPKPQREEADTAARPESQRKRINIGQNQQEAKSSGQNGGGGNPQRDGGQGQRKGRFGAPRRGGR